MNIIATTQRGNWLSRLVRRWWLGYRIAMIERDVEYFQREAAFVPLRIREYERAAAALRVERVLLED